MKKLLKKSFFVFSLTRGYNIAVVCMAQYLCAMAFLSEVPAIKVIADYKLFLISLSSALSIGAGYIINDFYDKEKDIINKPHKVIINSFISQNSQLILYFCLNIASAGVAWLSSFRTLCFFSVYIFGMWFYSHKLKKIPLVGNITYTTLSLIPLLAVLIHYRNFEPIIMINAIFLFLVILLKELVKDLENLKGDLALGYQTIAVRWGEKTSKNIIFALGVAIEAICALIICNYHIGAMKYYFMLSAVAILLICVAVLFIKTTKGFRTIHNIVNIVLFLAICSLMLVKVK